LSIWTRERLHSLLADRLSDYRFICVGNREPYIHVKTPTGIRCTEPDSGVVSALDPVLRATGGTWIAHGSGSADRETVDEKCHVRVPASDERYTLRRVWLTEEEEEGYYYGLSNEGLWPLCHIAYQRPIFRKEDWKQYVAVNEKFASAVVEEIGQSRALVFIQDYHFALLPKMVKERVPGAIVCQFWHIPWPNPESFRICPWKRELLEGLLGNDLLAFHIQHHCNNFLDTVDRELEARIDRERHSVVLKGSPTLIRPHPISTDFERFSHDGESAASVERQAGIRKRLKCAGMKVLLSVGRMDYTKGIVERLQALDTLLARHPEWIGKVMLCEIGIPSRTRISRYRFLQEEIESLVTQINRKYRSGTWKPIYLIRDHQDSATLAAYYCVADVCLVSSLHDGMNLVAKEYVAARSDHKGVLVLSQFTGAARELKQALIVNPYAVDDLAESLNQALLMPPEEQATRMERLRFTVREHNVYRWAAKLLGEAARVELAGSEVQPAY
jgi:trehalose 6-phosphate synthase